MVVATEEFQFALEDYRQKIGYLTGQFSRMWTRFNYFVTIQSALIGGKVAFGDGRIDLQLALFGAGLSAVWYVMGAEDRYLVTVYRKQVKDAGLRLAKQVLPEGTDYSPVGDIASASQGVAMDVSGWRLDAISTTRLAALIPLLVGVLWVAVAIARVVQRYC
jgi:hypothetical protein